MLPEASSMWKAAVLNWWYRMERLFTLNGQTGEGETSTAPLIDVEQAGNLIINSGVTLSGNVNALGAAAIDAKGIVVLKWRNDYGKQIRQRRCLRFRQWCSAGMW